MNVIGTKKIVILVNLFFFVLSACTKKITSLDEKITPINLIVSTPYLKDIFENVSCNSQKINIISILQPGVDPHTYVMSPNDRLAVAKADAVIYISKGLESWLVKIPQGKQPWFAITEDLPLSTLIPKNRSEKSNELELDYHIWQSPKLTKQTTEKAFDILKKLNPKDAIKFASCKQNYLNKIDETVTILKNKLKHVPIQNQVLATNHDAFNYFTREFGLRSISIMGLSDDAVVTPIQLRKMIIALKHDKVPTVFLETTGNMKNIQTVSKETGIKIGGELYGDSLGAKGTGADTVLGMWRTNMNTIVKALQ